MLPDSSDTGGCFERLLSGELPPLAGHDSMSAMADNPPLTIHPAIHRVAGF